MKHELFLLTLLNILSRAPEQSIVAQVASWYLQPWQSALLASGLSLSTAFLPTAVRWVPRCADRAEDEAAAREPENSQGKTAIKGSNCFLEKTVRVAYLSLPAPRPATPPSGGMSSAAGPRGRRRACGCCRRRRLWRTRPPRPPWASSWSSSPSVSPYRDAISKPLKPTIFLPFSEWFVTNPISLSTNH